MTPKDKAEELFNQYANVIYQRALTETQYEICKQCAFIVVGEMIEMLKELDRTGFLKHNSAISIIDEVKKEIEKL